MATEIQSREQKYRERHARAIREAQQTMQELEQSIGSIPPNLDEATRESLNGLSKQEAYGYYGYRHCILGYGIRAVAHTYVMREARDVTVGTLSLDVFLDRFDISFERHGFEGSLGKIESEGIFIPQQAYRGQEAEKQDERIDFFIPDYLNMYITNGCIESLYGVEGLEETKDPEKLLYRTWQASDFKNPEVVEQGITIGRDMWRSCVVSFSASMVGESTDAPSPSEKISNLWGKLIAYYSAIVFEPTPSKS